MYRKRYVSVAGLSTRAGHTEVFPSRRERPAGDGTRIEQRGLPRGQVFHHRNPTKSFSPSSSNTDAVATAWAAVWSSRAGAPTGPSTST